MFIMWPFHNPGQSNGLTLVRLRVCMKVIVAELTLLML